MAARRGFCSRIGHATSCRRRIGCRSSGKQRRHPLPIKHAAAILGGGSLRSSDIPRSTAAIAPQFPQASLPPRMTAPSRPTQRPWCNQPQASRLWTETRILAMDQLGSKILLWLVASRQVPPWENDIDQAHQFFDGNLWSRSTYVSALASRT